MKRAITPSRTRPLSPPSPERPAPLVRYPPWFPPPQKLLPATLPAAPPASAAARAFRHPDTGSNPPAPPAPPQSLSANAPAGSHSKRASPHESSARAPHPQFVFTVHTPAACESNPASLLQ